MKTDFSFDLDSIKRLSGSTASDSDLADKAGREMEAFAKRQAAIVNEFSELKMVVTNSTEHVIRDAVTALRHICAELKNLSQFFSRSHLIDHFDPARARTEKLLAKAETDAKSLLAHVYR